MEEAANRARRGLLVHGVHYYSHGGVVLEGFHGKNREFCQICGKDFREGEGVIFLAFSFCDEYPCGMTVHSRTANCIACRLQGVS